MLDGGVEPELAVLLMDLARPGILLRPGEIGRLHDRPVSRPMLHVLGREGEPFGDVEQLVPARLVMADIEVERVADHERGRIGGVERTEQRVAVVDDDRRSTRGRMDRMRAAATERQEEAERKTGPAKA